MANRSPTTTELNNVKQDTVQWPAKAHRVTQIDEDGNEINSANPFPVINFGSLVPKEHDEIVLTYVASGNGEGEIETVVYKLVTVTQATLTLSYNADNKLTGVVRT